MHDLAPPPSHCAPSAIPFSRARLFALTSGVLGLQVCWAVQAGYVTKSLLVLGLPQRYVSYAWLAGPIAGIVVQPTVGVLSDRCTLSLGRRRPFLIAGTLITSVCMLLFAYASQIGHALGDTVAAGGETHVVQTRALTVAIASFWALDFAINAVQGPLRALLADVVPTTQHKLGNAYFALGTGLGNCTGSFLGSVKLSRFLPFFGGDLQALYAISTVILIIFMGITVVFTKETPLSEYQRIESDPPEGYDSVGQSASAEGENMSFFQAGFVAPYPFWQVFLVQCFSWFGWFTLFVFATSWVGKEVYNGTYDAPLGSPKRELYDAGVRAGNLGIGLQSVLTIFFSLALPPLLRKFSSQWVYFAASVCLGSALIGALFLHHQWQAWIAVSLLASTGFAWAVTMTVPWSLMSEAVARSTPERAGIYATMFNLSQCFPEVVVSLVAEEVERLTNSQAAVMGVGGVSVLIAAGVIVAWGIGKGDRGGAEIADTDTFGADMR